MRYMIIMGYMIIIHRKPDKKQKTKKEIKT